MMMISYLNFTNSSLGLRIVDQGLKRESKPEGTLLCPLQRGSELERDPKDTYYSSPCGSVYPLLKNINLHQTLQ